MVVLLIFLLYSPPDIAGTETALTENAGTGSDIVGGEPEESTPPYY